MIKYIEKNKTYTVSCCQRHPKTGMPIPMTRKNISTLAEAKKTEKKLIVLLNEKLKAQVVPTWEKLVQSFMKQKIESGDWTLKTCDDARYLLNAYTMESWADRFVDEISTHDVRVLFNDKLTQKSNTVKQSVSKFMKGAFQFGIESGFIKSSPVPKFKYKQKDKLPMVLTADQAKYFLEKAKELNSEWYYHWAVALYTGMRNSEQFALTWDKVDFSNRTILVDTGWNKVDGFKGTKSGDERVVEIAPNLLVILKELKLKKIDDRFVLPRSRNWLKGEQSRMLGYFLEGIGLPKITYHSLRASHATIMMSQGVEPVKVMSSCGWKSLARLQIYVRKAGVNIRGMTDNLNIHDPHKEEAKVLEFKGL